MKKTITEHKFYIVDLVRKKPKDFVTVPVTRVDVAIKVEAKGPVPSSKMQRLEDAARKALEKLEDDITKVAHESADKIEKLIDEKNPEASALATKLILGTNTVIQDVLKRAEGIATDAVKAQLKKEGKQDALLRQAKVFVAIKVGKAALKTTGAIARSAASGGIDVSGFIFAAKACYDAYDAIQGLCADEEKRCKELIHKVDAYLTAREKKFGDLAYKYVQNYTGYDKKDPKKALKQLAQRAEQLAQAQEAAQEAQADGGDEAPKTKMKKAADFMTYMFGALKKESNKYASGAETARKNYRNAIATYRKRVDKASAASDKLKVEVKKIPGLVAGHGPMGKKVNGHAVKAAAEAMQFQRSVSAMARASTPGSSSSMPCNRSWARQRSTSRTRPCWTRSKSWTNGPWRQRPETWR